MAINVTFIGTLRHITGRPKMVINCSADFSVKDLIQKLILEIPGIEPNIVNQQTEGVVKNNALILVNDREISVLHGIDTLLASGDEVVFIPVVHGG